jgi:hypothetical protein
MFVGLIPIMWTTGAGSDVRKHRRADGWRHHYLIRPRARRRPGDLRSLEVALRPESRPRQAAAPRARRPAVARRRRRDNVSGIRKPAGVDAQSRVHAHTTTGAQDATQSLASLFPCQIGVTWTPPPTRERGKTPSLPFTLGFLYAIGRFSIRRLEPIRGAHRGEPRLPTNFRRILSLQIKEFRSRSSHLNTFTFLPTVFFSMR